MNIIYNRILLRSFDQVMGRPWSSLLPTHHNVLVEVLGWESYSFSGAKIRWTGGQWSHPCFSIQVVQTCWSKQNETRKIIVEKHQTKMQQVWTWFFTVEPLKIDQHPWWKIFVAKKQPVQIIPPMAAFELQKENMFHLLTPKKDVGSGRRTWDIY